MRSAASPVAVALSIVAASSTVAAFCPAPPLAASRGSFAPPSTFLAAEGEADATVAEATEVTAEATEAADATPAEAAPSEPEYLTKWGVDDSYTTTPSGLRYKDLVVGKGESATDGGTIEIHYTFWFDDFADVQSDEKLGRKYFSTHSASNPKDEALKFQFNFGEKNKNLIKGWAEGMETMSAGGKRVLIVPPELAYGDEGLPQRNVLPEIPAGAHLRFEIAMMAVDNSPFTKFRWMVPRPSALLE